MQAKIRHHQYILFYSGLAVMLFGLWSAVKIAFYLTLHPVEWEALIGEPMDPEIPLIVGEIVGYATIAITILFDGVFRVYIGLSAVREANAGKKRPIYIFVTLFYFAMNTWGSVYTIYRIAVGTYDYTYDLIPSQTLTNAIIEVTSGIAFVLIIISAIQIRRYRKKPKIRAGNT